MLVATVTFTLPPYQHTSFLSSVPNLSNRTSTFSISLRTILNVEPTCIKLMTRRWHISTAACVAGLSFTRRSHSKIENNLSNSKAVPRFPETTFQLLPTNKVIQIVRGTAPHRNRAWNDFNRLWKRHHLLVLQKHNTPFYYAFYIASNLTENIAQPKPLKRFIIFFTITKLHIAFVAPNCSPASLCCP